MDSCPNIICIDRKSAPFSSKCVANECLKVCGLIVFPKFILAANPLIIVKIMARVSCFPRRFKKRVSSKFFEITKWFLIVFRYKLINFSVEGAIGTNLCLFPFPVILINDRLMFLIKL